MPNQIPQNLEEMSKKQLRKMARVYSVVFTDETKKSALRRDIKQKLEQEANNDDTARSKEQIIADFIRSITTIDAEMDVYRDQKKDLKKSYKDNQWLDAKEQKRALKALRLIKDQENIDQVIQYYKLILAETGVKRE